MNHGLFSNKLFSNNHERGSFESKPKRHFLARRRKISIGSERIEGMLYYGNGAWYPINYKWRRTRWKYYREGRFQISKSRAFEELFSLQHLLNQAKLSQLNDITDIFHKKPHHQVACLLTYAGKALKNTGLQFKGALGLKKGKSKDKARDSRTVHWCDL